MSLKTNLKGPNRPSTSAVGASQPAECTVKVHTNPSRRYSIMQFNRGDNVDLSKWKQAKMERENNLKEFKMLNPDMPTSGAGSEFGRERKEEARRKKYGIHAKKYKEEDQPYILKQIGAPGKKYKGKKEGLISEISSYYIFRQQADGSFEAMPVNSWYSFSAVAKHKTLNAEEAEEEFGRRDRTFNFFSLMVKKRLKESAGEELSKEDEEAMKAEKTKTSKRRDNLRITEDDEYQDLMTSEESDAYMSDEEEQTAKSKGKKKDQKKTKRKKKQDSDDEGEEESDEGDFEGRELDYISENSSDDEEEQQKIDIKGLDEELQKIEDEEEEEEEEEEKEGAETKNEGEGKEEPSKKAGGSSSSSGSDSDDSDIDDTKIQSALLMQKKPGKRSGTPPNQKTPSKNASRNASRPETPTQNANASTPATANTLSDAASKLQHERVSLKRPGTDEGSTSKRQKTEGDPSGGRTPGKEAVGLTEDIVRRYLMRKPMTTKDLLYKLKSKKIGLKPDVIVKRLAEILRKLNPKQTKIKDKTYWFIKE